MPTATSETNYQFSFNLSSGDNGGGGSIAFSSTVGMTDEIALSIVSFFQGLPWGSGISAFASVSRHELTDVMSNGDPTSGVFS